MSRPVVAFDCDGTLIDSNGNARRDIVMLYDWFEKHGYEMVVWSHAGIFHAQETADKLGLNPSRVLYKSEEMGNQIYPDIAVDDLDLRIAKTMIRV